MRKLAARLYANVLNFLDVFAEFGVRFCEQKVKTFFYDLQKAHPKKGEYFYIRNVNKFITLVLNFNLIKINNIQIAERVLSLRFYREIAI